MNYRKFLLLILFATPAIGFNLETHALFTNSAFGKSVLSGTTVESIDLYTRLGFDRMTRQHPFSQSDTQTCVAVNGGIGGKDHYIDATGAWLGINATQNSATLRTRCPFLFEQRSMPPLYTGYFVDPAIGPTAWLRFEGWLMRGVIREDDFKFGKYDNPNLSPDQDPWVDEFRSVHHFYEPLSNSTGLGAAAGFFANATRSTTWALGVNDSANWANDQAPDPLRGNHFSYMDARRLFWQALTYKEVGVPVSASAALRQSNFRDNLWATTLKSVGHVVHLLQDGASPQHVRGEGHSFLCNGNYLDDLPEAPIATRNFENFANFRVVFEFERGGAASYTVANPCEDQMWRSMFRTLDTQGREVAPADTLRWTNSTYPIPNFSVQRKFFTTRTEDAAINSARGLMDYTNRGFYTEGKFRGDFFSPPVFLDDPSFDNGEFADQFVPGLGTVKLKALYWRVPDAAAPNYVDPGLRNGKAPIASYEYWWYNESNNVVPQKGHLSIPNYIAMQDLLAPRAIAYTTGLINFFFRGKLEIEPITQRFFGVVDLGQPHTVNADGYPIITATNKILGFEKIRLKVRNLTDPIIESGTNTDVPQVVGMGKLVAVARYHRNPCYKPDLSGERRVAYAPAPAFGVITEPVCPMGLRTDFQEISVSAELPVSAEGDLPGGRGGTAPASVEKTFDFSADPIPVNATDLFIQVVYRGQLGEETDGIAVGNFDVQEPTFYAGWNNTDYYFNESLSQWLAPTATFPARVIQGIRVCAGSPNSKWVYFYNVVSPQPGLPFLLGAASPGVVRLAFIFAKPATGTQQYAIRSTPVMLVAPSAPQRSAFTRGQERQASQEIFSAENPLPAPSYCQLTPPIAGATFWCFDPIKNRRGQNFGDVAQPLHYSSGTSLTAFPDVDAAPAQQTFPGLIVRTGGENKFNESILADCPAAPALSPQEQRLTELREEAWSLGVDPDAVGK